MFEISYAGAALAGLLSFFTPCILPMMPFYLCYMAGISMAELRADGRIAPGAQKRLTVSALMFALGVTTIFMLLGLGATALGQAFIRAAARLLRPKGTLFMVANRHLPYETTLANSFGTVQDRGDDPRFKILQADQPRTPDTPARTRRR